MKTKKKIVITTDWYYPGFKAGGPIRSVVNLVRALEDDLDIYVYTSDRDLGEAQTYESVESNTWVSVSKHKVFYSNVYCFAAVLAEIKPDILYINGIYSKYYSVKPILTANKINFSGEVIIAPRGMLSEGALKIKALKKKAFIAWAKANKLYKNVNWHCTSEQEVIDVKSKFSVREEPVLVKNISVQPKVVKQSNEVADKIKLVSVSRISSIKNLDFLIEVLLSNDFSRQIDLDIYGNVEDESYYKLCQVIIKKFSKSRNKISFKGEFNPNELDDILVNYNLAVYPTKNENFGHAIVESLAVGLPVMISNKTPWQNLHEQQCGFVLELKKQAWLNALREVCLYPNAKWNDMSKEANAYFTNHIFSIEEKKKYLSLFS